MTGEAETQIGVDKGQAGLYAGSCFCQYMEPIVPSFIFNLGIDVNLFSAIQLFKLKSRRILKP